MKVLWICNMPLPGACKAFKINAGSGGGWLYAEAKKIVQEGIELFCCFADRNSRVLRKSFDGEMTHYAIPRKRHSLFCYDTSMNPFFDRIIDEVKPDFVHIHGTENATALSLMNNHPELVYIVSIQGILTNIVKHECNGIPYFGKRSINPIAAVMGKGAGLLRLRHQKGSKNEIRILKQADYILGRTTFDEFFSYQINKQAKYIKAHEHLRDGFYRAEWNYEECQKHSILVCSTMPLKGLHFAIEAFHIVSDEFKDAQLRIIGRNEKISLRNITGYDIYIRYLIKKYRIDKQVVFLGNLDEQSVIKEMKNANVFALTSSIENSPNMLGEAMLIGTPCVASFVGGVPDMVEHMKTGVLYQYDAPYMLAGWIERIFLDKNFAFSISDSAKIKAREIYSSKNITEIVSVYNAIMTGRTLA